MKASEIIERFGAQEDAKRGRGYRAFCPVHESDGSHSPSLILDFHRDERKALVLCESRETCTTERIVVAAGLSMRDLFDVSYIGQSVRTMTGAATKAPASGDARRSIAATLYRYAAALAGHVAEDPEGEVASLLAKRYGVDTAALTATGADALGIGLNDDGWLSIAARTATGEVAFVQYRNPDPASSRRWDMQRNPDDRTRWDAAGFVGRRRSHGPVLIAEGMSDALTLAALDAYEVAAIRGAANAARVSEVASDLVGRDVVIVVDNDEAGRGMTKRLLSILAPITSSVAYVRLPEGDDVGDLRDEDPATFAERLAAVIAEAVTYVPEVEFDFEPYTGGTDADRAEAFVAFARAQGLDVAWTASHGWLVYDGTVWVSRADARVWQIATGLGKHIRRAAAEALRRGDRAESDRLDRQARGFLSANAIGLMLKVAQSLPGVHATADDFDANPDLLGVGNGVLDLRAGTLRPMQPEDRITRRLAVNYDPEATAPRWERFLTETLIDAEGETATDVVDFIQAMTGYGLTGHTSEQFFAIFTGTGANGKSVFLNVIGDVFGEVSQRTPFSTFEQKASGGIPNDLAMLKGARFVSASESDVNARMSESILKAVTGEDTITARFMRAEFFEYRPTFLLLLATNHLPRFLGQDNGLWRRVRLIEWRREFALHEQDRGLAQRIAEEEAEGVLAWAVEGARRWYAAGRRLPPSATIEAASTGYKEDSDVLGPFLAANVVKTGDRKDVVFQADLHDRFMAWQESTGETYRPGRTLFGRMMGERWGIPPRDAFPKHWRGYRLLAEAEVLRIAAEARRTLTGVDVPEDSLRLVVPPATTAEKYVGRFHGTPLEAAE